MAESIINMEVNLSVMNMRESIIKYNRKYFCPLWRAIPERQSALKGPSQYLHFSDFKITQRDKRKYNKDCIKVSLV